MKLNFLNQWASSDDVKIHYLDKIDYDDELTPLVYIPGAMNFAEQSIELLEEFKMRRCISLSLRGRGKSDKPENGYSLNDHVKDIQSVILKSNIPKHCILAYSMGVPYAIKYAAGNPNIKGIILCDYPAKYPSIPVSWSEGLIKRYAADKDMARAIRGIQRESGKIDLYNELTSIKIPVLILKGGTEAAMLNQGEAEKYNSRMENVKIIEFAQSGHDLWEPDREGFIRSIKQFLSFLDSL